MNKKCKLLLPVLFLLCLLFALPSSASAYRNEWVNIGSYRYYYRGNGKPATGGPYLIYTDASKTKKANYLFDSRGRLIRNHYTRLGGKLYMSLADGHLQSSLGKVQIGKTSSWFCGSALGYLKTGLMRHSKYGVMYFDDALNGRAVTNAWRKIGNYYLYFGSNGQAYRNGVYKIGNSCYCFSAAGLRLSGLRKVGGHYYAFDQSTGKSLSGWQTIGGKTYYFNSGDNFRALTNGFYRINGKVYYFNESGLRLTGWIMINEHRYYLNPSDNGARVYGKATINGTTYDFGTQGYLSYSPYNNVILRVNRANCVVTVYNGGLAYKAMTCSVGKASSPTPAGTFRIQSHYRWHELNGPSYGQYCSHFLPSYLFHSVPMYGTTRNPYNVNSADYNNLGQPASSGCIRLCVADAKWIYDNVPIGATVVISDQEPMPLGKPTPVKMTPGTIGKDPTDIWS